MRRNRTTATTPTSPSAAGPALDEHGHAAGEVHDHDRGLGFDLGTMGRRRALALLGVGGVATLVGCGSSSSDGSSASSTTAAASGSSTSASSTATADGSTAIPEETGGPYPGDGSNGPNVLDDSGIVRSDITTSFGEYSGTAEGVPLTVKVTLIDVAGGGGPLAGAAMYLWHCDREGRYSLYSQGVTDQNYLRGVQESDADGKLSFTTIYPAAYDGRWPHIHFEVYESADAATSGGQKLRTSQMALPQATDELVYATEGYEASVANLARTSLDTDMVFSDGYATQVPTITGSVDEGFTAQLNVGI
ncbi:hypothetical protein KSP35_13600 [Aquihabitans sp. G128]|uniref:dioxygenase family protein n=1 Tax=Aquihabitans sp. G128 TaxID=2849779 RepID=UPI001C22F74D|nr:hypothetical protein [Aquihabitans sp. G128]QXC59433.1 hypothetical protein KSP35_13600 [Aquihabitans sp. G128]